VGFNFRPDGVWLQTAEGWSLKGISRNRMAWHLCSMIPRGLQLAQGWPQTADPMDPCLLSSWDYRRWHAWPGFLCYI
jgi:hypothetical protein